MEENEKIGYERKSNAQIIADFLMRLHKETEEAIELEENIRAGLEIVLTWVADMEEKENE